MDTAELEQVLGSVVARVRERWTVFSGPKAYLSSDFAEEIRPELRELERYLGSDPQLAPYDRALLNMHPAGREWVHHTELAEHLVFTSLTEGPEVAANGLQAFINLDHVPIFGVCALSGVKLLGGIGLTPNLKLLPFEDAPESNQKRDLSGPRGHSYLGMLGYAPYSQPTAAFVTSYQARPKILDEPKGTPSLGRAFEDREVSDACLWLNLIRDARPLVIAQWYHLPRWVPFGQTLVGGGVAWPIQDLLRPHVSEFTDSDVAEVIALHRDFEALDESVKARLRIPLARLNQALRRARPVDQAIDLGTALEALLLEEDVRDQLSLTFRLRGAWLLGHSLARRSELYRVFRALYDLRSEAVHRGEVKWERRLSGAPINVRELLDRGFDLCREALRRIIHAGAVPDWETLLLGDRKP